MNTKLSKTDALAIATFPTILLLTTLFRLALNVSSTRLILLQANAGEVIRAFGSFVDRGNYVVGGIIFVNANQPEGLYQSTFAVSLTVRGSPAARRVPAPAQ